MNAVDGHTWLCQWGGADSYAQKTAQTFWLWVAGDKSGENYSVIWKSYLKRGLEKNWFKALVWPLQKVLEMLQSKKKMKKIQTPPSRQRGLGQKLPGVQNHHPNSTGSKQRQECQTMPACLVSLSYPTPVLHLSSISSLWMETKDFLQQAVAHWDGWPACVLKKQMAYTNLINISIS